MVQLSAGRFPRRIVASVALSLLTAVALLTTSSSTAVSSSVSAKFVSERGWVRPNEGYTFKVKYVATDAATATLVVNLPASAYFVSSIPAPASSNSHQATFNVGGLAGQVVISARAATLSEDPDAIWKNISATAQLTAGGATYSSTTNGPHITSKARARYGDRPFPVVNVQYQDITHCVGAGDPFDECVAAHPVDALDAIMNSRTLPSSVWRHYNDMSLGKLNPQGTVSAAGKTTVAFTGIGQHKFARLAPNGTCNGSTLGGPPQPQGSGVDNSGTGGSDGTPVYADRIVDGWYSLPGTQGFYGSDSKGHNLAAALTGQGAVAGIDDACGPTGKIAYDAASLADPDIDYNDFDSDRNGLVDFFEVLFAGDGGNGSTTVTGLNNVWPHSSNLIYYFKDANGQTGYVSNDQLRDTLERPLWWTDATRKVMTTTNTGDALKVYVRVGPYNVNPESAFDFTSVISHEYGHSLGLPDFYSLGSRETFGTWELMAGDYSQFMTGATRAALGWIVPVPMVDGEYTLRESKYDTHSIRWFREDGTPYELTGADVHNADMLRAGVPNPPLIDSVPQGTQAAFSGAGNDFGCPPDGGHGLLLNLPDLKLEGDATAVTLKFKALYEMEWDWDYGFVLVSTDGGDTWQSLPSAKGTTLKNTFNPNNQEGATGAQCFAKYDNGITGVSGQPNTPTNPDRQTPTLTYQPAAWIDDEYDLTAFKGKEVLLLLSYATDPAEAKRGWFVDSLAVTSTKPAGTSTVYQTGFEETDTENDRTRVLPLGQAGWAVISSAVGQPQDHAYYIEMRDRISWDFDGKGENDRGPITWQPGVSMVYTQQTRGWGNTRCLGDMPCDTPVDSVPQPGNDTPNLDDAAFIPSGGRDVFNGCTHIDNYSDPDGPDGNWKLPAALKFQVTGITGLSADGSVPASPATATIIADVNPNCAEEILPPELSIVAASYEDPDTDGSYSLEWTRPAGASGPDTLQEATVFETLFAENAEGGFGKWDNTSHGTGSFPWEASGIKSHSTSNSFWARYTNGADAAQTGNKPDSMLTMKDALTIPDTGTTTLTYWDFLIVEGDDLCIVEITADNGATWTVLSQTNRTFDATNPDPGVATEPLSLHEISLASYRGKSVKIRFRLQSGGEDRAASNPTGWFVDDIHVETSNFADVVTDDITSHALSAKANGTYYYRAKTRYPAGPARFESGWSNIVQLQVDVNQLPTANAGPDDDVDEGVDYMLTGSGTDPEGTPLKYSWTQTAGPPVILSDSSFATPTFTAPQVGLDTDLVFELTVTDQNGAGLASTPDEVIVTVHNVPTTPAVGGEAAAPGLGNNKAGGALPPLTLLLLALLAAGRRGRRRAN